VVCKVGRCRGRGRGRVPTVATPLAPCEILESLAILDDIGRLGDDWQSAKVKGGIWDTGRTVPKVPDVGLFIPSA
jgi:hypothetical protein